MVQTTWYATVEIRVIKPLMIWRQPLEEIQFILCDDQVLLIMSRHHKSNTVAMRKD